MALHDAYARRTPFEVAFPDPAPVEALEQEIAREVEARGVEPSEPALFVTMRAVAAFLEHLGEGEAQRGSGHRFGPLVFHAIHHRAAGSPVYLLETALVRHLVDQAPAGAAAPPSRSGYVQLPQHLLWVGAEGEGVPESLDGVFWTVSASGVLHLLPITGMRPDRPGFGMLPMPEPPLDDAQQWLAATMRDGGEDFASVLPGADVDGLYAVETAGEILKLVARFFAYADGTPGALRGEEPGGRGSGGDDAPRGSFPTPPASALPYVRVTWAA